MDRRSGRARQRFDAALVTLPKERKCRATACILYGILRSCTRYNSIATLYQFSRLKLENVVTVIVTLCVLSTSFQRYLLRLSLKLT